MRHPIPTEALMQHIAVLGKTGSGKTSTAKLAIEQVVTEDARVCVLDPIKSDWWGLTSSSDGKRAGLPFHILGGPRGHVPLHASAGKAIGEIVASGALPLSIIDMADFAPGGQAQFFVDFAPALIRKMRGVVYLVIEEAHLFAPKERSGVGKENMSIHWAKTLATAGRSKGIRLILATQRTQALHNALLGSCDTLIAHRLTAPADQEPVLKWLKSNASKEVMEEVSSSLASLKTGHAWVCAGEAKLFELREFPRIRTYDNTATPAGDGEEHAVKMAPVDPNRLRAIIGDAVKEAEANDPAKLKQRIRELERQVAAKAPAPVVQKVAAPKGVPVPAVRKMLNEHEKRIQRLRQGVLAVRKGLEVTLGGANALVELADAALKEVAESAGAEGMKRAGEIDTKIPMRVAQVPVSPRAAPVHIPKKTLGAESDLPKGESLTLEACIQYPDGLRREQLTVLTGYKRSSRDAYIQRLRDRGFVTTEQDRVAATPDGIEALPDARPLPTGVELQEFWRQRLPEGERKVLDVLIEHYPESVERSVIDERTGYQRSSRDAYLQRMRAKQLITEPNRGAVRASDTLFQ